MHSSECRKRPRTPQRQSHTADDELERELRTMMMNHLRAAGIRQETVSSLDMELAALRTRDDTPLLALMRYAKLGRVRITVVAALSGTHVCDLEMHLMMSSVPVQQLPVRGTRVTTLPRYGFLSMELVLQACW